MPRKIKSTPRQVANGHQKYQDAQVKPSKGKHKQRSVERHSGGSYKTEHADNLNNRAHEPSVTDRKTAKSNFAISQLGDLPPLPGQPAAKGSSTHRSIPSHEELNALNAASKEANSLSELGQTYEKYSDLRKQHLQDRPSDQEAMPFQYVRISIRRQATRLVKNQFKDPANPTDNELKDVSKQVSKFPDPRARRALRKTFNLPNIDNKTGKITPSQIVKAGVSASEQLIATLDSAPGESILSGEPATPTTKHYPKPPNAPKPRKARKARKTPKVSKYSQSSQPKKVNAPHAVNTASAGQNYTNPDLQEEQHSLVLARHQLNNPEKHDSIDKGVMDEKILDDDNQYAGSGNLSSNQLAARRKAMAGDSDSDSDSYSYSYSDSDSESVPESTFKRTLSTTARPPVQDSVTLVDLETEEGSTEQSGIVKKKAAPTPPPPPAEPPPPTAGNNRKHLLQDIQNGIQLKHVEDKKHLKPAKEQQGYTRAKPTQATKQASSQPVMDNAKKEPHVKKTNLMEELKYVLKKYW